MAEEQRRSGIGGIGDGIRTGIGILNAFREAVEETLQEAVERGELSPERARSMLRGAADRVQAAVDEARVHLEFVPRREFDELRAELNGLRARLERLERERGSGSAPPDAPGIIVTE